MKKQQNEPKFEEKRLIFRQGNTTKNPIKDNKKIKKSSSRQFLL
jgi:hypothetical protein